MKVIPDSEGLYSVTETDSESEHSYNNFERILFLLILFTIIILGTAISLPLFVLAQARALLLTNQKNREKHQSPELKNSL